MILISMVPIPIPDFPILHFLSSQADINKDKTTCNNYKALVYWQFIVYRDFVLAIVFPNVFRVSKGNLSESLEKRAWLTASERARG